MSVGSPHFEQISAMFLDYRIMESEYIRLFNGKYVFLGWLKLVVGVGKNFCVCADL
jgi:hypothetical protein